MAYAVQHAVAPMMKDLRDILYSFFTVRKSRLSCLETQDVYLYNFYYIIFLAKDEVFGVVSAHPKREKRKMIKN